MLIRTATEDDRLALFKLCAAMHAESDMAAIPFDPQRALENLGYWLGGQHGLMLVADDNGDVIGLMAVTVAPPWFSSAPIMGENIFYVRPDRRNGRAAWKLVERFVALARELGVPYARAGVVAGKVGDAASRLYERHGMHLTGANHSIHFKDMA